MASCDTGVSGSGANRFRHNGFSIQTLTGAPDTVTKARIMAQGEADPVGSARRQAHESTLRQGGRGRVTGRQSWAQGRSGSALALGLAVLIFCAAVPFVHSQTPAPSGNEDESNYTCNDNTSVACTSVIVLSRKAQEIEIKGDSEGRIGSVLTRLHADPLHGL